MHSKIAVYTAIFGRHDTLRTPNNYINGDGQVDYYCITDDKNARHEAYKIIHVEPKFKDITKNARFYKIFGLDALREYDYSIWHDGSLTIDHDSIDSMVSTVSGGAFSAFKHPKRNCVYDEAVACLVLNKDYSLRIVPQMFYYWINGQRKNEGMIETSILVKDNNKYFASTFPQTWWNQILRFSRRDQLSIMYAIRKSGIKVDYLSGYRDNNPYSTFRGHQKRYYEDKGPLKTFENRVFLTLARWTIKILKTLSKDARS